MHRQLIDGLNDPKKECASEKRENFVDKTRNVMVKASFCAYGVPGL